MQVSVTIQLMGDEVFEMETDKVATKLLTTVGGDPTKDFITLVVNTPNHPLIQVGVLPLPPPPPEGP